MRTLMQDTPDTDLNLNNSALLLECRHRLEHRLKHRDTQWEDKDVMRNRHRLKYTHTEGDQVTGNR